MNSHVTQRFRKAFAELPQPIRQRARAAYKLFKQDPNHPSLHFKPVHATQPIYSVRISLGYRAIGVRDKDDIVWFWIGSHADYEKLLVQL